MLTQYPIAALPRGPGIDDAQTLLSELEAEGRLISREDKDDPSVPHNQYVYSTPADCPKDQIASEIVQAAGLAAESIKGKLPYELEAETHINSRAWNRAKLGDIIDPYIDVPTDEEYEEIRSSNEWGRKATDIVFGQDDVESSR